VTTNPVVTSGSAYRVLRGGSWDNLPWVSRTAYRYGDTPVSRYNGIGFRVLSVGVGVRTR
jgi:formylglycine-generating enzyme required for sulfatase activity